LDSEHPTRIPDLITERLVVRELAEDDLDAYAETVDRAWGTSTPREEHRRLLAWTAKGYDSLASLYQPPYGDRAVTLGDGTLIGLVGLVPALGPFGALLDGAGHDRFSPEVGMFWLVHPDHQGRGYATEAASALAAQALAQLRLRRLVATTEHANEASIRVMRRLGMTIHHSRQADPAWFQVVGVLDAPQVGTVNSTPS
jgi:ribosomal-protein-alanine N-acetyltransferase